MADINQDMYRSDKGIIVGILFACYGLWLIYKGLINDVWMDGFGEPILSRTMYIVGGLFLLIAGLSLSGFILHIQGRI